MKKIILLAGLASSVGLAGNALAADRHHAQPHHPVCHIEHHKAKVHGKWIMKQIKVCK